MSTYCHYHPADAARWACDKCVQTLCYPCMPDANRDTHRAFCPHCGQRMRYLGEGDSVVPFWQRVSSFFLYPFSSAPLTVIGICTVVPLLAPDNLIGLGIGIFLWAVLTKYLYQVLEATASGTLTPPSVGDAFAGGSLRLLLQQLAIFALMFAMVAIAYRYLGNLMGSLLGLFMLFALPASAIALSREGEIAPAINPLNLLMLIARIGWPYVIMYTHILLILTASSVMIDFAIQHTHRYVAGPIVGYLTSYFMVVIFHLIGYVMYQFQSELMSLTDHGDDDHRPAPSDSQRFARLEADIDMAIKDGEYEKVQTLLESGLKQRPHHPPYLEKLWRLLMARPADEPLRRHHQKLLPPLISANRMEDTTATLRRLTENPEFNLQDGAILLGSCQMLYHAGEYRLLLSLARDLHKRLPDCAQLPEIYLLVAKSLANGLKQWDKAVSFLKFIETRYPEHPSRTLVARYLGLAAQHQRLE